MILRLYPSRLCGSVSVPPSKSLLHRELICRRLAGQTTVLPPHPADDIRYTAAALEQLDVPAPTVQCGDSGSTLRFLLPLFMALGKTGAVFTGSSRLLRRPIPADLGLRPVPEGLALTRPLRSGTWTLSAAATSQVVSGLLMALPLLPEDSDIMLTDKTASRPYLDMTCRVLRRHGVTVTQTEGGYHIDGGQRFRPAPLLTAPDWSAAAFWLVLAHVQQQRHCSAEGNMLRVELHEEVQHEAIMNKTGMQHEIPPEVPLRGMQGDSVILSYLDHLPPCVDMTDTPDLLMPLALYAALQPGRTTRFTGCGFLRGKESDRPAAVAHVLNSLGAQVREEAESLTVTGVSELHGGCVDSFGDHRIAMLAGCAAMLCGSGSVTLTGGEQVAKSYPDFWKDMESLGGRMEVLEP